MASSSPHDRARTYDDNNDVLFTMRTFDLWQSFNPRYLLYTTFVSIGLSLFWRFIVPVLLSHFRPKGMHLSLLNPYSHLFPHTTILSTSSKSLLTNHLYIRCKCNTTRRVLKRTTEGAAADVVCRGSLYQSSMFIEGGANLFFSDTMATKLLVGQNSDWVLALFNACFSNYIQLM